MKSIFILTFLLLSLKAVNISTIYTLAHKNYCKTLEHPLYYRLGPNEGWVSLNLEWIDFVKADVDNDIGYIQFLDEGTGGGSLEIRAKLFLDSKESGVMLITKSWYDTSSPIRQKILAFEFRKDGDDFQVKMLKNPLPKLDLEDFVDDRMSIKDFKLLKSLKPSIVYRINRGKKVTAFLVTLDQTRDTSVLKKCIDDKEICSKEIKMYKKFYGDILPNLFAIDLLYKNGEFKISKRYHPDTNKRNFLPLP